MNSFQYRRASHTDEAAGLLRQHPGAKLLV